MIKDVIDETEGLELSRLMGFASDGASVMIGAENGVAAKLKMLVSELHSAHCVAHREALAVGSAVKRVALAVSIDKLLTQVIMPASTAFCVPLSGRCFRSANPRVSQGHPKTKASADFRVHPCTYRNCRLTACLPTAP